MDSPDPAMASCSSAADCGSGDEEEKGVGCDVEVKEALGKEQLLSARGTVALHASRSGGSEEPDLPLLGGGGGGALLSDDRMYTSLAVESALPEEKRRLSLWFVAKIVGYILIWYTLSTCLTLYNKEMLGNKLMKFPAPFLMNTVHFAMQAMFSRAVVWFQNRQRLQEESVQMTWIDYLIRVVPTALGAALDINLSNISLVFISVTFATMCKSAAPVFILLFAFLFRLEKPSFKLLGIMLVICLGVLLTVAKEAEFNLWGFILIMFSAVMAGFRWSMTQILLQKEEYGLKNPFVLMSNVAPVMAIATAIFSLVMDPWHDLGTNKFFNSSEHAIKSSLLLLLGGTMALFMVLIEYVLVSTTSAVTVTVAGIVKEAVTILFAVLFFNDPFTWLKGAGLAIIIIGVSLFNVYKFQRFREDQSYAKEDTCFERSSNGAAKFVILDPDDPEDADHSLSN